MGRQTMRNYPGLIDSVMTYTQNCVASNRPDDKVQTLTPSCLLKVSSTINTGSAGNSSKSQSNRGLLLTFQIPVQYVVGPASALDLKQRQVLQFPPLRFYNFAS